MQLPIEWPLPTKDKYLDEETSMLARWFIFGEHPDGIHVDVSDGNDDIVTKIPKNKAELLIKARNAFVDAVLDLRDA
jgi:hypothetical protein